MTGENPGMPKITSDWGPVTVLLVAIVTIAAIAGAVVTVTHPETLSFEALLNDLEKFAVALGILGVGRGLHQGLTNTGLPSQGLTQGVKAEGFVAPEEGQS